MEKCDLKTTVYRGIMPQESHISEIPVLNGAIAICIVNGKRLQEDARLLLDFDRNPSALAVVV